MDIEERLKTIQELIDTLISCDNDKNDCVTCESKDECPKFIRVNLAAAMMLIKELMEKGGCSCKPIDKNVKDDSSYFT